jgi:DNA-binding transcriptional LysR family regulator
MQMMIYIHHMNLASLDLNLLKALDALLLEANVGRAAMRLQLSQPAASHALRKLREALNDPLLVRVGARMELTPRAQALREPLAEALNHVRGLFAGETFDPKTSERHFRLLFPDLEVELLGPAMARKAAANAPGVVFDFLPWRGPEIMTAEFTRSLDLITSVQADGYPSFHRQRIYTDSDALAVRKGHPLTSKLKRKDVFLEARHIAVVGRGQREDVIDYWLRDEEVARKIAVTVPSYIEALHVVARTDLVAFVPRKLIASLAKPLSLVTIDPPFDPGIDEQFIFYPTRAQRDPASIWLRNLVSDAARSF